MPFLMNRCWNRIVGLGMVAYLAIMNITSLKNSNIRKMDPAQEEVNSLVFYGVHSVYNKMQLQQRQWKSAVQSDVVQQEWILTREKTPALKIILLWDGDSIELLQHNLRSLHAADYFGHKIDVQVQMPASVDQERLESFRIQLQWEHGDVHMVVLKEKDNDSATSLRDRILQIWRPTSEKDNIIIFHVDNHSNQHPNEQWYQWLQQVHAKLHTTKRNDIAGVGLSTKKLQNELAEKNLLSSEPFLFPSINFYSGFAPTATMWQDFADYVDCALRFNLTEVDRDSKHFWDDVETLWMKFVATNQSFHLYQFPDGKPLFSQDDLVGLFSRKARKPKIASQSLFDIDSLSKYDYKYDNQTEVIQIQSTKSPLRTVVMSAAIGYPIETFKLYVGTLRKFYQGDIALSINATITDEIAEYLKEHNVQTAVQPELTGTDGTAKARDRFPWFASICQADKYDLCLHTDFRDSLFQADPFAEFYDNEEIRQETIQGHVYIYQHEKIMNPWSFRQMAKCGIYDAYGKNVAGKHIVNSGSIIATPDVWEELGFLNQLWNTCNDQLVFTAWVYTEYEALLPEHRYSNHRNVTRHYHRQAEGAMNIVGYAEGANRFVERDSQGRFLNRNCLPSPVVHQFDRVK